jgi:general secretion pathway protein I
MRAIRARREGGFTLLEVLVATVIAAIALAVLFGGIGSGLRATHAALRREEALVRARSHLAALNATALVPGRSEGDDGGGWRWSTVVRPAETAAAVSAGPAARVSRPLALYDVQVRISPPGDDGAGPVTLDTRLIAPAPADSTP